MPSRRAGRALRMLAAVAAVAVALTGCGGSPDAGPIYAGRLVTDDPGVGGVVLLPEGPTPGAPPADIVRGFLRAGGGYLGDHATARRFLISERRADWQPEVLVRIFPATDDLRVETVAHTENTATVRIEVPVVATIDENGVYRAQPRKMHQASFGLVLRDGQWRLTDFPDGMILSRQDFTATFGAYSLYFPDRSGEFLVPDVRWIMPQSQSTATVLVKALLEGPAQWLLDAVVTGAPRGTRLSVPAVVVEHGVATVDLSSEALNATYRERRLLIGQLQATLKQPGSGAIREIRVTVEGADLELDPDPVVGAAGPPASQVPAMLIDPAVDGAPLLLGPHGGLARWADRKLEPLDGLAGLSGRTASHPAVSMDGSTYAVLLHNRSVLRYKRRGNADAAQTVLTGKRLTPPSFDPRGWVWSTPARSTGTVTAVKPPADPVRVRASWLAGFEVRSLRISRDGARALIVAARNGKVHLFASGVERAATGTPLRLGEPLDLVPDLRGAQQAVWADEDSVVVLGGRGGAQAQPWIVQVGGEITETYPVAGARSIAAGAGEQDLYLGTDNGQILRRAGRGWTLATAGRWPAFPG